MKFDPRREFGILTQPSIAIRKAILESRNGFP